MKNTKQWLMIAAVAAGTLFLAHEVMARGGGGGGGFRGGGGFHGGSFGGGGGFHGGQFNGSHNWNSEHNFNPDHRDHPNVNPDNWRNRHNPNNWPQQNVYVQPTEYVGDGYDGCGDCGATADALAGMAMVTAVGAEVSAAQKQQAPQNTTIVVQGSPVASVPVGTQSGSLPPGCQNVAVNNAQFYQCGSSWYKPFFGPTGVYYQAVQSPLT